MTNQSLLHTPEGVRDLYGSEYAKKQYIEEKMQQTIASFGYQGIATPSFEFFDVFSKEIGTIPSNELYKFFDRENNTLVLRPDFTPSIARCAAKYFSEEDKPIRLTYCGSAFTNLSSSYQGKLSESTQLGAELIGDGSVQADAEVIALMVESLKSIGLESFLISIGEVNFFKGLCAEAGITEETQLLLRSAIVAKNYFAAREVLEAANVPEPYDSHLSQLTELNGGVEMLKKAKDLVYNPQSLAAIKRLESLYNMLEHYGVAEYVSFDFGMLSKYRYYTGVIFKAYTQGVGNAIITGGRYDHLLGRFGKEAPAIGFCLVVDDIMEACSRQKIKHILPQVREIAYTAGDEASYLEALAKAKEARAQGERVALIAQ